MSLMPLSPLAARTRNVLRTALRWTAGLVIAGASIVLAAWLILQWGILPRAEAWKPELEAWATRTLGVPVRAGRIEVGGGMWSPMLTLRDVRLLRPDGQPALQLDSVRAVLAPRSLLPRSLVDWAPHFEQILIETPAVEVRRDAQGAIWVAGIPMRDSARREDSSPVADWLFRQREVVLLHGDVRWLDEQRGTPALHLRDVTLLLRNQFTRHRVLLEATPPEGWGDRFTLRGDFRSSLLAITGLHGPGDWRRWRGQAQVQLPLIDIEQLGSYVPLPWALHHGRGRLSAWLDIDRNAITGSSADVALRDVSLKAGPTAAPLDMDWLQARISFERRTSGQYTHWQLGLQQLRFQTDEGVDWPASDLVLALDQATDGALQGGRLELSSVDLQRLARLADHMPLPRPWHAQLDSLQPLGRVQDLRLRWQGPLEDWRTYWASGTVKGLAWAAQAGEAPDSDHRAPPGRPGLRQLDGSFEFNERNGHAALQMRDGELDLPGVFEDSRIPVTELKTEVRWQRDLPAGQAPAYKVEIPSLRLVNPDLQATVQGQWRTGRGHDTGRGARLPGLLDLKARITRVRLERVPRYLPLSIGTDTRHYLQQSLLAGQVPLLTLQLQGDLAEFPFEREGSGEFKLRANVEQARYAYAPPRDTEPVHWPVFTDLRTEVLIDRGRLQLRNGSARLGHSGAGRFSVSDVQGQIEHYLHDPVLAIDGLGQGPLEDALHFVSHSPIDAWIGHTFAQTRASGEARLRLGLRIPLVHSDQTTVRGTVQLDGNDLAMTPDVPLLAGARARVEFTEKGFSVSQASARVLGGVLTFDGAQQADGSVRFSGQGTATAEGLRRATEVPWLAPWGRHMTGQTPYRLQLGFVHGQTELTVQSPLTGLGLKLPAPLGKAESESLPLRVSLQPQAMQGGAGTADLLRIELGRQLLDAQYLRRHVGSGPEATVQVVRGAIGLGQAAEWPAQGVSAQLSWPTLSVDEWVEWSRRSETDTRSAAGAPNAPAPSSSDRNDYLPARWQVRSSHLTVAGRSLDRVRATVGRETGSPPSRGEAWVIDVEADQLAGRLELQGPGFGLGNGPAAPDHANDRVLARLSRLAIPRSDVRALGDQLERHDDELPALDVSIEKFELHGQPLGRLELQAAHQPVPRPGDARTWRIARLAIAGPEAQVQATGQWQRSGGPNPSQTSLDFKMDIRDAGQLLERFGIDKAVRGGRGLLNGTVRWRGAPLAFDWGTLGGNLHLEVERGQFLQADAGAAKLLGLLNLQSLPRRLLLDFRDVTQSGFPFDRVDGDFGIENGITSTRNLRVRGVQALILTEGHTDLVKETQDLHVWVIPEINAGAASLAYAVVNPAIGLGTLLGQMFLRRPLAEAATREFRVSGTWEAPDVTSIPRRQHTPPDDRRLEADPGKPPAAGPSQAGADNAPQPAPNTTP